MAAPQVTLQSITGVDVELRIAGIGSRSFAFVIDWHIRLILAFAWWVVGTLLMLGKLSLLAEGKSPGSGYLLWVVLPASAIYLFYHPVLEILMRGSTPGKRMAGRSHRHAHRRHSGRRRLADPTMCSADRFLAVRLPGRTAGNGHLPRSMFASATSPPVRC